MDGRGIRDVGACERTKGAASQAPEATLAHLLKKSLLGQRLRYVRRKNDVTVLIRIVVVLLGVLDPARKTHARGVSTRKQDVRVRRIGIVALFRDHSLGCGHGVLSFRPSARALSQTQLCSACLRTDSNLTRSSACSDHAQGNHRREPWTPRNHLVCWCERQCPGRGMGATTRGSPFALKSHFRSPRSNFFLFSRPNGHV